MRSLVSEIRGPERGRGAVGIAEVGNGIRNSFVEVPAAAAEKGRLETDRTEPVPLLAHEAGGIHLSGRARMIRRRPVGVQAERPTRLGLTRTFEPASLVLPGRRGPHERGDREAARPALLYLGEPPPDLVVQWALHMARDDRVPPVQYVSRVRHRRPLFTNGRPESGARGRHARRAPAPRARRRLDRRLRALRAWPPTVEGDRPRHGL